MQCAVGSYRAPCVQSDSARKLSNLNYGSDWGLILAKLVNSCEMNFGVFPSVWKLDMLNV